MYKPHPTYFGYEVGMNMHDWQNQEFAPSIRARFGEGDFTIIVLDPSILANWMMPVNADSILAQYSQGASTKIDGPEGLTANVAHKLRFAIRTGLQSKMAAEMPWLVEPGDFPYDGAGCYKGFWGGASGFKQDEDWVIFTEFVDKIAELRAIGAEQAMKQSADRIPGMKYLEGNPLAAFGHQ